MEVLLVLITARSMHYFWELGMCTKYMNQVGCISSSTSHIHHGTDCHISALQVMSQKPLLTEQPSRRVCEKENAMSTKDQL